MYMRISVDNSVVEMLNERISKLEEAINADCISVSGPILPGVDQHFNKALQSIPGTRRDVLAVILQTPGGVVEIADRMVQATRHLYGEGEVHFYVPDQAMSAGTIMALSGDRIFMNYFSVLGPIDPQVPKGDKLLPALAYLSEYDALIEKSRNGTLTAAEFTLLNKFDIGELHTFKQAKDLSIELLEKWLSTFKFKDWDITESRRVQVTEEMRKARAKQIASDLMDHNKWHSHSRCISMDILVNQLKIKIDNYWDNPPVRQSLHNYWDLLADFLQQKAISTFVHSRYYI